MRRPASQLRRLHDGPRYYTREELANSPSIRAGFSPAEELKLRRQYTRFIQDMTKELKLTTFTCETAVVLCHRFYAERSLQKNDRLLIACGSIFLASKNDDSPRTARDVALAYYKLKTEQSKKKGVTLALKAADVDEYARCIHFAEHLVLDTLSFQLQVDYPTRHVLKWHREFKDKGCELPPTILQTAVGFCNDSLDSTLRLQYKPEEIGKAVLSLSCKLAGQQLPPQASADIAKALDIEKAHYDDIADQIMQRYPKLATSLQQPASAAAAQQTAVPAAAPQQTAAPASAQPQQKPAPASAKPAEEPEEGEIAEAPAGPSTNPKGATAAAAAAAPQPSGAECMQAAPSGCQDQPEAPVLGSLKSQDSGKHEQPASAGVSGRLSGQGLPLEDSANEDGNNTSAVSPSSVEVQQAAHHSHADAAGDAARAAVAGNNGLAEVVEAVRQSRKRTADEAELSQCAASAEEAGVPAPAQQQARLA